MKPGWIVSTLGETCEMYQPKTITSKEMMPHGSYPVFGANGVIGRYDQFNHEKPQLLITCRGATCGSVNVSEPMSWITGNAMVVRPKTENIDLRFLEYLFRGGMDITPAITGAAQPQITRTNLNPIGIRYPLDFEEQQRIVAILDEAFDGIATAKASAEKNLQNARALFQSYREEILAQCGKGWMEKPLAALCDIKHGFAFKSEFFTQSGDHVLLTPGNFYESGGYRDRGDKQKYYSGEIPKGFLLTERDLLVAMTEQAVGLLGSPVLIPNSGKFLHNQRLGLVTQKSGVPWTNEFFFHVFNKESVRHAIHASATGVKVRHTSPTKIGEVVVAFPTSIPEQRAVVSRLIEFEQETQRLESIYQQKLASLDELKKSLLYRAFAGEL
jgi:type I restriction enzyme, S subunit